MKCNVRAPPPSHPSAGTFARADSGGVNGGANGGLGNTSRAGGVCGGCESRVGDTLSLVLWVVCGVWCVGGMVAAPPAALRVGLRLVAREPRSTIAFVPRARFGLCVPMLLPAATCQLNTRGVSVTCNGGASQVLGRGEKGAPSKLRPPHRNPRRP